MVVQAECQQSFAENIRETSVLLRELGAHAAWAKSRVPMNDIFKVEGGVFPWQGKAQQGKVLATQHGLEKAV